MPNGHEDDQHQHATIIWLDGDVPLSKAFDDPFYSRRDGQAEVGHVFLGGNHLPQRWDGVDKFHIAELGFGTGLNFIETWRQWIANRRTGQTLKFTSFERFPMEAEEIRRALAPWPELAPLADELLSVWSGRTDVSGPWQLDGQTELNVIIGDATTKLPVWKATADAWFLDGFSPAKNPDMWSRDLMVEVGRHTNPGGTFATYTAAGWVRRNLEAAGFNVAKRRGHAGKRDMSVGVMESA